MALFVNNVTDERALLALDQERGTRARVGYLTNQPRTFGITDRLVGPGQRALELRRRDARHPRDLRRRTASTSRW
jgi:hypothetical protein